MVKRSSNSFLIETIECLFFILFDFIISSHSWLLFYLCFLKILNFRERESKPFIEFHSPNYFSVVFHSIYRFTMFFTASSSHSFILSSFLNNLKFIFSRQNVWVHFTILQFVHLFINFIRIYIKVAKSLKNEKKAHEKKIRNKISETEEI